MNGLRLENYRRMELKTALPFMKILPGYGATAVAVRA